MLNRIVDLNISISNTSCILLLTNNIHEGS